MQADTEVGVLPRFTRDIAFLTGSGPATHQDVAPADHCVLKPFSGLLDVSLGPGLVPRLDLSYLTLEPLVVRGLDRSTESARDSRPATTVSDEPATRDSDPDHRDEGREPRVRDVIHGDREGRQQEQPDRPGDAFETHGPARRHLDLETHRSRDRPDSAGSATKASERSLDARSAPTARSGAPTADSTGSTETATDLDKKSPAPRDESGDSATRDRSRPDHDVAPPDRSGDATADLAGELAAPGPADDPGLSVIDRSGPTAEVDARFDSPASSSIPLVDSRSPGLDDIARPRMVTRREAGQAGHREAGASRGLSHGEASTQTSRRSGAETAGFEARETTSRGSARPNPSGVSGPDTPGNGPRMTVQRSDRSHDRTSRAGGESDRPPAADARGPGDDPASAPSAGRDAQLDTVIDASADPESRLVDRLYRALQERDAIERRRRGGR